MFFVSIASAKVITGSKSEMIGTLLELVSAHPRVGKARVANNVQMSVLKIIFL